MRRSWRAWPRPRPVVSRPCARTASGTGPDEAFAPPPLAFSLLTIAASTWLSATLERHTGPRRRLLSLVGTVLLTQSTEALLIRMMRRRGRTLGLRTETAPVVHVPGSMLMQLAISAGYALSYRARQGSSPAVTPANLAAGQLVRELMSRRSWRDAMKA